MRQTLKLSAIAVLFLTSMTTLASTVNPVSTVIKNGNSIAINTHSDKSIADEAKNDVFSEGKDTVYVSLANPELKNIKIEVRDGLNRLIYSKQVTGATSIAKTFHFNNAFKGYYTIKLNNGSTTYSKEFEIL